MPSSSPSITDARLRVACDDSAAPPLEAATARMAPAHPSAMPPAGDRPHGPPVLHVVGWLTGAVFHLLGPVCEALAAEGHAQIVLLLDSPEARRLATRLPAGVVCDWVPASRRGPQCAWRLGRRLQQKVAAQPLGAVHLHGMVPLALGVPLAARLDRAGTRVVVTPHSSRSLRSLRWLGGPLLGLLSRLVPLQRYQAIANVPFDVRALQRMARVQARLIESPVADVFCSVAHQLDAPRPLVAGGAPSDAEGAVQRFAQLAVLTAGNRPDLRFIWTSPANAEDSAVLKAAGIDCLHFDADDYQRAHQLAQATVYVAPVAGRGFPMEVAEAMAVGLPVVAEAASAHLDLLEHGHTGLLAEGTMNLGMALLDVLDAPPVRRSLGEQARAHALQRFSGLAFRQQVRAAYAPQPQPHSDPQPPGPADR